MQVFLTDDRVNNFVLNVRVTIGGASTIIFAGQNGESTFAVAEVTLGAGDTALDVLVEVLDNGPGGPSFPNASSGGIFGGFNAMVLALAPDPNQPPTADAGADQSFDCVLPDGIDVNLAGVGTDPDPDDTLTYSWELNGVEVATTANTTQHLTPSAQPYVFTFSVFDGVNGPVSDTVEVTVTGDTTAPTVTAGLELIPGKGKGGKSDDGSSDGKSGKSDDRSGRSDDRSGKSDDRSGKSDDDSSGRKKNKKNRYRVVAGAADDCDANPAVSATLNGHPVVDGQEVVIEIKGRRTKIRTRKGVLHVTTPQAVLVVTATDASGNPTTETVTLQ